MMCLETQLHCELIHFRVWCVVCGSSHFFLLNGVNATGPEFPALLSYTICIFLQHCKVMEIVAEDLAPKKSYSDLVEMARDDQVYLVIVVVVTCCSLLLFW